MVNDGLSKWGCCIHVNGPTAERVHDGYKKGEEAFPIQRRPVGGVPFHSIVFIAHCKRFDAVIVKQMASDTAALAEIGLSRHRSGQIKVYSACHRLHGARELT
jgi:hypothetical protein